MSRWTKVFFLAFWIFLPLLWTMYLLSHFLYRFLDGKKTTRSQFSVPGLREIHRNLKQEKKFNSRESFFRKSPFCTFSCINPGFGGPWVMIQKKNSYCHFHNASKECFWPKKFLNFMPRFKSAILAIFQFKLGAGSFLLSRIGSVRSEKSPWLHCCVKWL